MKNIVLFFCDITGTIIGKEKNLASDYQNFHELLLNIKDKEKTENLVFSIVSSDNHSIISNQKNILKNYFSEPIILGKQFFYDGYIINNKKYLGKQGKIEQILTYIEELNKKFNIIRIYYADDCEIFHIMLNEMLIDNSLLVSIIPKNHQGLKELNNLLEDEITNSNTLVAKKI